MAPANQTAKRTEPPVAHGDDAPQPQPQARRDGPTARPSIDWLMLFDD
jgi:hypothetical protein